MPATGHQGFTPAWPECGSLLPGQKRSMFGLMQPTPKLTIDNFKSGFLVDNEVIGGVTELDGAATPVYAAYVSHYLTGETFAYQEFEKVEPALEFLANIDRAWEYEAVGCSAKTGAQTKTSSSSCGSGACGSCGA